jgi:hypothetical protein
LWLRRGLYSKGQPNKLVFPNLDTASQQLLAGVRAVDRDYTNFSPAYQHRINA